MNTATLLHIPHASTRIPPQYAPSFSPGKLHREIDVMTDWFCDALFDCGRDALVFPISRLVCDVERFRDDADEIMAGLGMGVTYRTASDLTPLRSVSESEQQDILTQYYDVHHSAFTAAVEDRLAAFGRCLIIDCHSFFPTPLPYELCRDPDRPDFCIGTSAYHTPPEAVDTMEAFLSASGYRVKIDAPFAGTIVPMKFYQKDPRVSSLMIEVNRRLYMDAPGVKNDHFEEIRALLQTCIALAERILAL